MAGRRHDIVTMFACATRYGGDLENIALWVVQAMLALFFLVAGSVKSFRPIDKLARRIRWVKDVPVWFVRFVGACEVAGAVGLILPAATSILPRLTIAAGAALVVVMASASLFHLTRREYRGAVATAAMMPVALFVTYGRWVLAPI